MIKLLFGPRQVVAQNERGKLFRGWIRTADSEAEHNPVANYFIFRKQSLFIPIVSDSPFDFVREA